MGTRQLFQMINTRMEREEGMTYEELIRELKTMRKQVNHYRRLTKEMHRLDAEYWYVQHQAKKGALYQIELPNADKRDSRKG